LEHVAEKFRAIDRQKRQEQTQADWRVTPYSAGERGTRQTPYNEALSLFLAAALYVAGVFINIPV
jgi:hypothetical protein